MFKDAAASGHADAQLNLGNLYYNGIGVNRDYRLALRNFKLAAQQGHVLVTRKK